MCCECENNRCEGYERVSEFKERFIKELEDAKKKIITDNSVVCSSSEEYDKAELIKEAKIEILEAIIFALICS